MSLFMQFVRSSPVAIAIISIVGTGIGNVPNILVRIAVFFALSLGCMMFI